MIIGIIGDAHLGASYSSGKEDHLTGTNSRLSDYKSTMKKTIDAMIEQGVSEIIFTGDIFETRHPSLIQQKTFSEMLSYALREGISVIRIVIGNHDQNRANEAHTLSFLHELDLPRVKVYDRLTHVELTDDSGVVANLILMPYRDGKWLGKGYQGSIEALQSELDYTIDSIDNSAVKVVVGHFAFEGTVFADDSDLYTENELYLPVSMFKKIDFTVMGHVHTPGSVSLSPYISYVGSMEKRGAFENHKKKFCILDLKNNFIEFQDSPCRDMFELKIDFSTESLGETLMSRVKQKIDYFAKENDIRGAIFKLIPQFVADDSVFFNVKEIENYITSTYKVHFCPTIKPLWFSARQARDSNITETTSDAEAFSRFAKNTMIDYDFASEIEAAGLAIIKAEG